MGITFRKISEKQKLPAKANNIAFLQLNNWDDYSYKTLFSLTVFDELGNERLIGSVKIGYVGQKHGWTETNIPEEFDKLQSTFYSLGQDADYYRNLVESLSVELRECVLIGLGDVAYSSERLLIAEKEDVFRASLLRSINQTTIDHQFQRILKNEAALTHYNFFYERSANEHYSGIKVEFEVKPNTKPSSNIHILIGRNGVGKTTLLNNMVDALLPNRGNESETGYFVDNIASSWLGVVKLPEDYFAGIVSISFSAFDPFTPPIDQPDGDVGMRYCYIGLKKRVNHHGKEHWILKDKSDLCQDFTSSLLVCCSLTAKRERWIKAVNKLESDFNFAEMDLTKLTDSYEKDLSEIKDNFTHKAKNLFDRMSSGHAIVLLTVTKLIETVEEKTLVLLDEPESHLHPPLLSAFTRTLSELLFNRNGVAIIATHSPVVLQEVPTSCVSILRRTRLNSKVDRPERETFAENVGVLTREVFGLEVSKSGFHDLLSKSVADGKSYEEIEEEYDYQLGFEGKAILRSLIQNRD